ncbi:MAG: Na+/H+ antiporter, partial [Gemmatimonadaceae bacterium]
SELRTRIASLQAHDGVSVGERKLRTEMIRAERRMLVRLRNEGAISDEVLLELEQALDHEAVRVGAGDER